MADTAMIADKAVKRSPLFLGNQWVNTIYTGYTISKHRIFLLILEELQEMIEPVRKGKRRASDLRIDEGACAALQIDMSNISHYNNYYHVREHVREMCLNPIRIYNNPDFTDPRYLEAPLLHSFDRCDDRKMLRVYITRDVMHRLLHIPFSHTKNKAFQYTKFDHKAVYNPVDRTGSSSKYMMPLYLKLCGYAEKGAWITTVKELRELLQVEEKYSGWESMRRNIIEHVQEELKRTGAQFAFNFGVKKKGRTADQITFKIFANTAKYDYNDPWLKIQRALTSPQLPYFARLKDEEREQLNYILQPQYRHQLHDIHNKLLDIHKKLVRRQQQVNEGSKEKLKSVIAYILVSLAEQFPPPG